MPASLELNPIIKATKAIMTRPIVLPDDMNDDFGLRPDDNNNPIEAARIQPDSRMP